MGFALDRSILLEALEERVVPSVTTFTVTDTSDDPNDTGSLRYAMENLTGNDSIDMTGVTGTITLLNGQFSRRRRGE